MRAFLETLHPTGGVRVTSPQASEEATSGGVEAPDINDTDREAFMKSGISFEPGSGPR